MYICKTILTSFTFPATAFKACFSTTSFLSCMDSSANLCKTSFFTANQTNIANESCHATTSMTKSAGKFFPCMWSALSNAVFPHQMSHVMRKTDFCICENKDADQLRGNREADQRLCFRYLDSTFPLLSKSKISSL